MTEKATLSYHNNHELKARFIGHVEKHRLQDSLLRGTYGTMAGKLFRGCAVGCSLRSLDEIDGKPLRLDNNSHEDLAKRLGIPLVLAHLEDRIFEGLPAEEAMLWPTLFARAIPVGADLSQVWARFAVWMLVDPSDGMIRFANTEQTRAAINNVAELYREQLSGKLVSAAAAAAAASYAAADAAAYAAAAASYAAADAAAYAAAAAAYAADAAAAAYAAAAASYAAASYAADAAAAAYAAAYAAAAAAGDAVGARWSAARQKHYKLMAEALLHFMSEAK